MAHPLDGIEAKLARADTHFEAVHAAVKAITETEPDMLPGEFDPDASEYLFRAQRDSREADWLSPVIGDCVHNLRAALDYLVWAMTSPAIRNSKHANKVEFPIFWDGTTYDKQAGPKIRGVPDKASTVIKCLQPFNGPQCRPNFSLAHPKDKPLWHLFELDNWDKHRALNLTEHLGRHTLVLPPEWGGIHSSGASVGVGGGFKRGTVVGRLRIEPNLDSNVNVYLHTTYDVAFDKGGPESVAATPVLQVLDDIRSEIRSRVLPSLRGFVPAL